MCTTKYPPVPLFRITHIGHFNSKFQILTRNNNTKEKYV